MKSVPMYFESAEPRYCDTCRRKYRRWILTECQRSSWVLPFGSLSHLAIMC